MQEVPNNLNQLEFYLLPVPFMTILVGAVIIFITVLLIKVPKIRPSFKPLFKIYYAMSMFIIYLSAGLIYIVTIGKVKVIQKLKDINFFETFKKLYLDPKGFFEDMRTNPINYKLWVGFYIYFAQVTLDYFLIVTVTQLFYGGKDTIIFSILSTEGPTITTPIFRWLYMSIVGVLVWIPTKILIPPLISLFHKYDKNDEPVRPWYDKSRLLFIGWGYILTADMIWCLGMVLTLLVAIFVPSWEVLMFTWVCIIICGIIELVYQQYCLQGLFKMSWFKSFIIWGLSMLPFVFSTFLFVNVLGGYVNGLL